MNGEMPYMQNKNIIIYDIGANIGNFAEKCFINYPNACIIMVEPNDDLAETLKKKFKDKNVYILNDVVSNINDFEIDFFISYENTISTVSKDWMNNSRFSDRNYWTKVIKKKTITIDSMIDKFNPPDLIKIDTEGHELYAIKGLTSKQKKICFEWAEEQYENIIQTFNHLENLGYRDFGFIYGDDYLLEPEYWTNKKECIKTMDMIPYRKDKWGMCWVK
jgi:FkbM family methyltransferase